MPVIENKNSNIKVGTVSAFPTNTIIPEGWLICNGAILNKNDFPDLFSVIGYTYGGSGNSFNVPNLQGRFIREYGTYDSDHVSEQLGNIQLDTIQTHYHNYQDEAWNTSGGYGGATRNYLHTVSTTGPVAARISNETKPINMAMVFCIKY